MVWCYWIAHRKAPKKFTYGYKNATIIAAYAILLLLAVLGIVLEAVQRVNVYQPISSITVILVAFVGVVVNGLTAYFFVHDSHNDINIRGAFLHMLFDAFVSIGVIVTGLFILWKSWFWIDTVVSFIIAFVITLGSWGLIKESINLMLLATPASVDLEKLNAVISKHKELIGVHDLHIWPISTTETALSVHLVVTKEAFQETFVRKIEKEIKTRFPISHVTIQIELQSFKNNCETSCC
ncbi:cation diffusion facilitator family transporter [Candidatus Lariskella endosymbiont of Hedychridium roseum]|uniref:cation diffusion facilitator family transporter n=1 Tax=Candidatus Lariskella endosymbiont of Hedychridium roseum TaxID=3077949 RepID=UPI0030CFC964